MNKFDDKPKHKYDIWPPVEAPKKNLKLKTRLPKNPSFIDPDTDLKVEDPAVYEPDIIEINPPETTQQEKSSKDQESEKPSSK